MKTIDIYGEIYSEKHIYMREACRGIIVSNGKILLSYEKNCEQYMIPGGGVENNETLEECCTRELAEETGYVVKPHTKYLTIYEHYDDWLFISHYFVCEQIGKTEMKLTDTEIETGLEFQWLPLEKAIEIFSKYQSSANKKTNKKAECI